MYSTETKQLNADILVIRVVFAVMLALPLVYLAFCSTVERNWVTATEPPLTLRTILYFVVIAAFPLINLIRHIMLRLNQTMPGETPPKTRYFTTVVVSLLMAEGIAVFGVLLYMLGDEFYTLLIFCLLSLLAMLLYRPKIDEYRELSGILKKNKQGG